MRIVVGVNMNRKDLIEELHRLKDAIKTVNDDLYLIEDDLINSCNGKHDNMAKYVDAIYDGLNVSNNNLTKAITNLHINKALYEKR